MGSGGMIVMDENTCMVDIARFFIEFIQSESCGKCAPCRVGTRHMLDILDRICCGEGNMEDLDNLEQLAMDIKASALCGLGQTAPNPVLTSLKYFRDEYEEHIRNKKCRGGVCLELIEHYIDEEICKGCGLCAVNCPEGAISGEKKKPHWIDISRCIKCGVCIDTCRFDAVRVK